MKRTLVLLLAALAPAALAFTEAETRAIAAHGPWPPAFAPDPSNRASGNKDAIELGERLFFERRLSANGEHSCSRCHVPERNWTDGEARALGLERVERNTPSIANEGTMTHFRPTLSDRWPIIGWETMPRTISSAKYRPAEGALKPSSS